MACLLLFAVNCFLNSAAHGGYATAQALVDELNPF